MPKFRPQLFVLTEELWNSISFEEIDTTVADMKELGIYHPPFEEYDIQVPGNVMFHPTDTWNEDNYPKAQAIEDMKHWKVFLQFRNSKPDIKVSTRSDPKIRSILHIVTTNATDGPGVPEADLFGFMVAAERLLIVLLATRNATKEVRHNKAAALGIGKGYATTTYIKIGTPVALANGEAHSSGATRRPHLRRGHIRQQRHGQGLTQARPIWIEPTFINADESFMEHRTKYQITRGKVMSILELAKGFHQYQGPRFRVGQIIYCVPWVLRALPWRLAYALIYRWSRA